MNGLLVVPVFVPILLGILVFVLPRDLPRERQGVALLAAGMAAVAALLLFLGGKEGLRWEFSYPALEIQFHFQASQALGLNLLVVTVMETIILLLAVFAAPQGVRSNENFFFLLYGFGVANGILISEDYVEMILFGELLFVTIYGAVALLSFLSSLSKTESLPSEEPPHPSALLQWANSRVFSLFGLGITKSAKMAARLVYVILDRGIDGMYEKLIVGGGKTLTGILKAAHNGHYANYLSWVMGGFILLVWFLAMGAW